MKNILTFVFLFIISKAFGQRLIDDYTLVHNNNIETKLELTPSGKRMVVANVLNDQLPDTVYIKELVNEKWITLGQPIIKNTTHGKFGYQVSISDDGNRVAISNHGSVLVFQFKNDNWSQLGDEIFDLTKDNFHGDYLAFSGDGNTLAISNYITSQPERITSVKTYKLLNDKWISIGQILGEAINDQFGTSLDLNYDGTIMTIGAPWSSKSGSIRSGFAKIYEFSNNWVLKKIITGLLPEARCGWGVSLSSDGKRVLVLSPFEEENLIRIIDKVGDIWQETPFTTEDIQLIDTKVAKLSSNGKNIILGVSKEKLGVKLYNEIFIIQEQQDKIWKKKGFSTFEESEITVSSALSLDENGCNYVFGNNLNTLDGKSKAIINSYKYDTTYGKVFENKTGEECIFNYLDVPLEKVKIKINNKEIFTDKNGYWFINDLSNGTHIVNISPGKSIAKCDTTFTIIIKNENKDCIGVQTGFERKSFLSSAVFGDLNLTCEQEKGELGAEFINIRITPSNINLKTNEEGKWNLAEPLPKGKYIIYTEAFSNKFSCENWIDTIEVSNQDTSINIPPKGIYDEKNGFIIKSFYDFNQNGIFDPNETSFSDYKLIINGTRVSFPRINELENKFYAAYGTNKIEIIPSADWEFVRKDLIPSTISIPIENSILLPMKPKKAKATFFPTVSSFVPICDSIARTDFNLNIFANVPVKNTVELTFDRPLIKASLPFIKKDSIYTWNIPLSNTLTNYFSINYLFSTPVTINESEFVTFKFRITSRNAVDSILKDTIFIISSKLLCSFDPNDKLVHPLGIGNENLTDKSTKEMTYTIRFQNTGNYYAKNILIKDEISKLLDINTIRILASSHPVTSINLNERLLSFSFLNINLPWSKLNEEASNGFVSFAISPMKTVEVGDVIKNKASIIFDKNTPIITNETSNKFSDLTLPSIDISNISELQIYLNPIIDFVKIKWDDYPIQKVEIFNITGKLLKTVYLSDEIEVNEFESGIYIIKVQNEKGEISSKLCVKQ